MPDADERVVTPGGERDEDAEGFFGNIKPNAGYVFHSDYFKVDTYYATVMSFFHIPGASDRYGAFWGVNRIPSGLAKGVTTVNFEQVARMGDGWVSEHQTKAESVAGANTSEQGRAGSLTSKHRASRTQEDLVTIAKELNDGASYLSVADRLLVKAPTLEALDEAVSRISRLYMDRFGTMHAAPFEGAQRQEMSTLFSKNSAKRGSPFYFTSTEYAGSYSLVSHGLEDARGEYVGYMVGDFNTAAVVMDVDDWAHHVVVATPGQATFRGHKVRLSDMWASKISQAAMLDGHRVVHIILDGADMDRLGPAFEASTWKIDMSHGDVNMFEMFGDTDAELSIFPTQMRKLVLMAEQAYETNEHDRAIIRGSLEEIATDFYIDQRMWRANAQEHRERLRVVGIPHDQVPKLEVFVAYLDTEYKKLVNTSAKDPERLHALSVLATTFQNLLSNNGDLFNTQTASSIDGARDGRRVIYDFGRLMRRGRGVAMAQLVNIIAFAVSNLGAGDVVVIHGAELIDPGIRDYVDEQFAHLFDEGGRVAYCYGEVADMVKDVSFNHFDSADWTCLGHMTDRTMGAYTETLGQAVPADLVRLVTKKAEGRCYVRRGFDNVVFVQDLILDTHLEFGKRGASGSSSKWRQGLKRRLTKKKDRD